jgi:hypothetical protein
MRPGAAGRGVHSRRRPGSHRPAAVLQWRKAPAGRNGMEVLVIGFGIFVLIWVIVLWGSRYFGPKT